MDSFDRDKDRRRRKSPFDFMDDDDFERIFDEMQRMFESTDFKEMIEDMFRGGFDLNKNKRFVHGFSINGRPRFQEFGNRPTKTPTGNHMFSDAWEPLTDIIEGEDDVAVTVEIPGVEKEDIDITATEDTLEITVNNPERRYHKIVDIPFDVKPKSTEATYKNGVLDVVVKRAKNGEPGTGYRVNID
ncbi:MAG: Hsp20/alpha crystallin family protein [Candidatus Thermoplasmatota archaeon]|nr:Hsp20/alpha crystallin family protein [Candidatus Thermoplasmatota archaeon]